jgi:undecaprenyl-diphosphatase
MDLLLAVIMGVLQGATEFLPVSSSGHLRLAEALFQIDEPEILFDVMLHVGTLVAVSIVYRKDIAEVVLGSVAGLRALVARRSLAAALEPEGVRLALLVLVATVPTGLIGLALDKVVDGPWIGHNLVGALLIANGGILLASRAAGKRASEGQPPPSTRWSLWGLSVPKAIVVGIAQGVAVLPGISRSGLTITTALFLGVDRESAAKYSFLMSIPAILGALVLKFDARVFAEASPDRLLQYAVGTAVSAVVGIGCLTLLLHLLRRAQFHHFAWYCFALGGLTLVIGRGLVGS